MIGVPLVVSVALLISCIGFLVVISRLFFLLFLLAPLFFLFMLFAVFLFVLFAVDGGDVGVMTRV